MFHSPELEGSCWLSTNSIDHREVVRRPLNAGDDASVPLYSTRFHGSADFLTSTGIREFGQIQRGRGEGGPEGGGASSSGGVTGNTAVPE